jgi:hypothetical protein
LLVGALLDGNETHNSTAASTSPLEEQVFGVIPLVSLFTIAF